MREDRPVVRHVIVTDNQWAGRNGVHLALRHEGQKVNRIVMTSERMANCPPVKEWSKSFGFDSSSSLVVDF
ncbi:hypothetical protein TNCV_1509651 [Trichonephila clavipes]|nr:hypothetical protein TNCV_1509651 [Trichonephila clavipes]